MGPRRLILAGIVGLVISIAAPPAADASRPHHPPKKATRSTIEGLEDQWRTAQLSGDTAAMDKLLSDDFVGINASGQVNTKAQQLDRLRNHKFMLTQLDLSDVKIKLVGQIAIVTSTAELSGMSDGAPLSGTFRYTRVYQRLPGGIWKITSFEATRVPRDKHHRTDTATSTAP